MKYLEHLSSTVTSDALHDLAAFTLGQEEHLDDVIAGYGIDLDVIHAWWSLRISWPVSRPGCRATVVPRISQLGLAVPEETRLGCVEKHP